MRDRPGGLAPPLVLVACGFTGFSDCSCGELGCDVAEVPATRDEPPSWDLVRDVERADAIRGRYLRSRVGSVNDKEPDVGASDEGADVIMRERDTVKDLLRAPLTETIEGCLSGPTEGTVVAEALVSHRLDEIAIMGATAASPEGSSTPFSPETRACIEDGLLEVVIVPTGGVPPEQEGYLGDDYSLLEITVLVAN